MSPDFWDVVSRRRSVRRYALREVPPEVVERILRAAASAPSAHDAQPWHFVLVDAGPARERLIARMAERREQDRREGLIPRQPGAGQTRPSSDRWRAAPVLIVACLQQGPHRSSALESVMGTQSLAAAVATLLLAAAASGLGSCWYAAPLFCPGVVREALGTDPSWEPQALVTLGYPAASPPPKTLKPLEEILTHVS
jgi:F420 biosynthesis protein FbiB-like protein